MESKWIILGCSPFIAEIKDFSFLKRYKSIAINCFYLNGVNPDYRCAYDKEVIQWIKDYERTEKLILNKKSYGYVQGWHVLNNKGLFDLNPHYLYETSQTVVTEECGKLFGHISSAIPAINYAILQGAKEVYLIGVDFNWNKGHFYDSSKKEKRPDELETLRQNIKWLRNYADIYRCNPDKSLLLSFLPYKEIKEL